MPEGGFPTPSAEPPSLQKNEWWMSNNSNSSSYPPNDDFKEISPQEVTPGSEGFVKALRLALDGNLTTLNDSSNNARTTPSGMHACISQTSCFRYSMHYFNN